MHPERVRPHSATGVAAPAEVKAAVRAGSATDNLRNWRYIWADWAMIATAVVASVAVHRWIVYLLAVITIGSRMRALANLVHEAAHRKLFRHRPLNDVIGRTLCAWPVLIGFAEYQRQHRLHHQHLWEATDPDFALYRATGTQWGCASEQTLAAFAVRHVVLAVVPVQPWRRLARELRVAPGRAASVVGLLATSSAMALTAAPGLGGGLLLYWVVPWLTAYQTIAYWAELGEHGGLRGLGRTWGTRNWEGGAVSRWLIGSHSDDPFHLLHHCFPSVPHYRLTEVDAVCRAAWRDYASARRCAGFFVGRAGRRSVLRDMWLGSQALDESTQPRGSSLVPPGPRT